MLAKAMDESRAVPTATSFRTIAVDTLDAKRKAINAVLKERGLKVSFTHLVAWAIVQATKDFPVMVRTFEERDGKPFALEGGPINLGIAVDVERKDGSHSLLVPAIRGAEGLDFAGFHSYYEDLIAKTRESKLTADDFQGTNISLTNPGGIGTVASVPRLLAGQSAIIATGSIAYPPEWLHASPERLKQLGVSKVMTLTSTYDHRVIQGAESGAFLRRVEQLLQGEDGFYESVAADLGIDAAGVTAAHPASASAPPLGAPPPSAGTQPVDEELLQAVQAATSLLKGYRTHGHLAAHLDPLGSEPKGDPALAPENLNLTPELMSRIPASILRIGVPGETLLEALPRMRDAYCGTIAYQFEHLSSHQQRIWLREMIETGAHRQPLGEESKRRLLERLIDVFEFERFLERTYLGQKMFSIEGLDVIVPMLDELVTLAHRAGAEEVVFGMAHRGRLSVLAHNLGRPVESILAEFEGSKQLGAVKAVAAIPHGGTGDVKYHYGHRGTYETYDEEKISVRLYPNPSHLEFVDPVVTGGARFLQSEARRAPSSSTTPSAPCRSCCTATPPSRPREWSPRRSTCSRCGATATGGTVHIVQNNQVGFTTDPEDARSTPYAADMAKGFNVPIVHVNADDVEACTAAVRLAMAYRERWGRDIVIDVIGYRRFGHNETDEPAYTQPTMAAAIKSHKPVSEIYAEKLVDEGVVSAEDVGAESEKRKEEMSSALQRPAREDGVGRVRGPDRDRRHDQHRRTPRPLRQPAGRHRGRGRDAAHAQRGTAEDARGLQRPPQAAPPAGQAGRGARAGRDRLRPGRGARLRLAARRRRPHPPHRPGHRARHLLPPSPRPARREHRPQVHADAEPRRRHGPVRAVQQPALGDRLPRVRVRVLGGDPERTGALGGPVRRLRQRRPGDHRQLHRLRRGEVGTDQPPHPAAPARLRGLGPRALQRPHRALPRARRRGQHPDRQPDHRRPVLPPAAPPGADPQAAAAGRLHPEGAAAPRPRRLDPGRS